MPPGELLDDFGAVEEVRPQGAAYEELANLAPARPLRGSGRVFRLCDKCSGLTQEGTASVRQFDATFRPIEERGLQFLLETLDLLA